MRLRSGGMVERGIHRRSEVSRLVGLIEGDAPGLTIAAVSGPGGVGKSFLVEHALGEVDLAAQGVVRLSADGSNPQLRGDFFGVVEGQLARRGLPSPAPAGRDGFPRLRKVAALHREIVDRAAAELSAKGAPESTKHAALALLRAARFLNAHLPMTKGYFDVAGSGLAPEVIASEIDTAWTSMTKLDALREGTTLPAPLRDLVGATRRNRVKRDLFNVTAEALAADLAALARPPVRRVVLVIDDYEALAPLLGEFLVGALVPRLADAAVPVLLLVSGRDELTATHPGWAQHAQKHLAEQLRLAPFAREDALALLAEAGVAEERRARLFELTQGFPFLLTLAIEEAGFEGAGSALFLRKFFDRTTRWMAPREVEWFVRVVYLDVVNEDTLALVFPGEDVRRIQDWFEREASVRDPHAPHFCVRPLIREKVRSYLELRSPTRHRELTEMASGR